MTWIDLTKFFLNECKCYSIASMYIKLRMFNFISLFALHSIWYFYKWHAFSCTDFICQLAVVGAIVDIFCFKIDHFEMHMNRETLLFINWLFSYLDDCGNATRIIHITLRWFLYEISFCFLFYYYLFCSKFVTRAYMLVCVVGFFFHGQRIIFILTHLFLVSRI